MRSLRCSPSSRFPDATAISGLANSGNYDNTLVSTGLYVDNAGILFAAGAYDYNIYSAFDDATPGICSDYASAA